jgi:hypothetical protein
MSQSKEFQYYRRMLIQIKEGYKPTVLPKALELVQRRAEEDNALGLEDKIEVYKLIDKYKAKLRKE